MYKNKKSNNKNGITLIALIITIIIMLILVAVTVSMAINGGLFEKAGQAVGDTGNEINKEQELANGRIQIDGTWYDSIDDYLKKKPSENQGTGSSEETINWEEILADANTDPDKYKHPEQSSSNGDIGIGTDGKPVNLDKWNYRVINGDEIGLSTDGSSGSINPGYQNSNIVEGQIIGKVPQYIKKKENSEFSPVTDMKGTFYSCPSLTTAPEIPSSVTNMDRTFYYCESLTTAPKIPSSVTNMASTFEGCPSLTTAPEIPSSVTSMDSTFWGCTSLTTPPPTIPSSVIDMASTFRDCTSLTIAPEILIGVKNMDSTFYGCTSLTIAPEIPASVTSMGSGNPYTDEENGTFWGCTSLITPPPTIPTSVTSMIRTFKGCTKLQGTIEINATIPNDSEYYYYSCFWNAATESSGLVVTGSSEYLDEIIATKSEDSKITKGT